MNEFDKMFEEAPTADEFDKMFDSTGTTEPPKTRSEKLTQKISSGLKTASDLGEGLLDKAGESFVDSSMGAAQGLTLGFADEISAAANTFLDKFVSKASGEEDINKRLREAGFQVEQPETSYEEELQRTRDLFKKSEERSPWLYGGSQLAASIPSGNVVGGALGIGKAAQQGAGLLTRIGSEALKAAPGIALETYGASEGSLLGDEEAKQKAIEDLKFGLGFGALAGGTMEGASVIGSGAKKLAEPVTDYVSKYIEDSPQLRQLIRSYEKYGKEYGVSPTSETAIQKGIPGVEGGTPFSQLNLKRAEGFIDDLEQTRRSLGDEVEQSLTSNINKKINLQQSRNQFMTDLANVSRTLPNLDIDPDKIADPKISKIVSMIKDSDINSLNPKQVKSLMTDLDNIIQRNSTTKYGSMELDELNKLLIGFRSGIDQQLKSNIPDYAKAASNYTQYMKTFYEQPIAGKYDPELNNVFYSDIKDNKLKLTKAYETFIEQISNQSKSGAQTSVSNLIQAIEKLKQRGVPINFDSDVFLNKLKEASDDAAIRRAVTKTQESQAGAGQLAKQALGQGETGKAWSFLAAQKAGKTIGRGLEKVYKAPKEQLLPLASRLEGTPALKFLGSSLREAIEQNDAFKRNAALFSILQNPAAKALIDTENEMEE
jgi:hypothetical protein